MLPTFVIGLREGLEGSLIVSIVAAFLQRRGLSHAMRSLWAGVALALVLCIGLAVGLQVLEQKLPAAQQAAFTAVTSAFAVCMVTYMIVWMARHAHGFKRELEAQTALALGGGSSRPLIVMAFLAVLREGFETVVFLMATFQNSVDPLAGRIGAVLGLLGGVGVCYGIYTAGVKINLGKFFQATGAVLVLVAGGLVASVVHSLAATGLLGLPREQALDLRWLVQADSIQGALLSGMFGIRAQPTVSEVGAWLIYVLVVSALVFRPVGERLDVRSAASRQTAARRL